MQALVADAAVGVGGVAVAVSVVAVVVYLFLQLSVLISNIYFPLSSVNQATCQLIIQFISIFLTDVLCHLF